jgi:hypothetical protein
MAQVLCPKCNQPLAENVLNAPALSACTACGVRLRADVFPAVNRPPDTSIFNETVTTGKEAGCFYHPDKRALTHCATCGRFLCALCDLEINDEHLCAACLEVGRKEKTIANLENHRVLYDKIALFLSIIPFTLVLWFSSVFTAPAAIFVAIRYWHTPCSIMSGSKFRFILAFLFASTQIIAWAVFIYATVTGELSF